MPVVASTVSAYAAAARSAMASPFSILAALALQAVESARVLAEDPLPCDLGFVGFERLR
jgi:hypothetical protein